MLTMSTRNINAYYDNEHHTYWVEGDKGWISVSETSLVRHLRKDGYCHKTVIKGSLLTTVDQEILDIQNNFAVDYAGPIAGWNKGYYDLYGKRVLVTSSPKLLVPAEGDWSLWEACLNAILGRVEHGKIQVLTWKANDKLFLECLYGQFYRPGAATFLIGGADAGKSFFQDRRTTYYGGRVANPWLFIQGKTPFNEELTAAEHHKVSDPHIYKREDRADLADMIKNFLFDEAQSSHGKCKTAISLPPRRRMSFSCNKELHNMIVPSLDASMLDKLDLNLCSDNSVPPPGYENIPYGDLIKRVEAELPAYVWHLQNEFKIPVEMQARRCGVKTWHHPELVHLINENLRETQLEQVLVDYNFFQNGPWEGDYQDFLKMLEFLSSYSDVKSFTDKPAILPYLLSKLQSRYPDRYLRTGSRVGKRRQGWKIFPPKDLN
jgi:hypothetical protein